MRKHAHDKNRGFTLIELLVVTAILVLITTLILANNSRFGGAILLQNFAYDVALSVRKAQVYGIAVRRFGSGEFEAGYGVHFSVTTPTIYVIFADAHPSPDGDGLYDPLNAELVETLAIQRGFRVADLCATENSAIGEVCGLTRLDIIFKRPEPDAFISANGASGILNPAALRERGRVILESPRGDRLSIVVEVTGQISVQNI